MTGSDLLHLAGHLVVNTPIGAAEARYRAAVSCAYYGVFHLAVATLADFGLNVVKNHTGHDDAYRKLFGTSNRQAQEAARLLHDLRGDRNEADYDLSKSRFSRQLNAKLVIESAHDCARLLGECLEEPNRSEILRRLRSES